LTIPRPASTMRETAITGAAICNARRLRLLTIATMLVRTAGSEL